ncbi:MAG: aminotransferase class IV [Flavobacteriaceae bacterium]
MINYNGVLKSDEQGIKYNNRSFLYGDGCFESIRVTGAKICFVEDHYFRLMASVRMLRMEVSMEFTLEYFEAELYKTLEANPGANFLRLVMYRKEGGLYTPKNNAVDFVINAEFRSGSVKDKYELGVYKDFLLNASFLNSIKSTQKEAYVLASIFASENHFDACLMLNNDKQVVSSNIGNIFIVKGNDIITAPLNSGALNGIIRKKIKEILENNEELNFVERDFNPFELQKADEVFISNVNVLIQAVSKYKKKHFNNTISQQLRNQLLSLI